MDVDELVKRLHQGRIDKAGIRRAPDKVKREAADALQSLAARVAELEGWTAAEEAHHHMRRAENARLTALVQTQGEEAAGLRVALMHAGSVFMDYAELHMRKGTEDGMAKARRNLDEAHAIDAALKGAAHD